MQLSGELSKVNLANLLQLVKTGLLTGKISFSQGARAATIFVANGSPVHAEAEGEEGVDGIMELFLWTSGSFSFNEEALDWLRPTISKDDPETSFERLLKDGLAYAVEKRYLDELKISPSSVLTPTGTAVSFAKQVLAMPGLERLDGRKTLAEALGDLQLSRREYVRTISSWIADGLADVVEPGMGQEVDPVELPNWVITRLKQDNPNISQAIVDMVIWVDRVKCWMFQVDADLYRVRKVLEATDNLRQTSEEATGESSTDIFQDPSPPPASMPFLNQGGPVRYGDPSYWRGSNYYSSSLTSSAIDITGNTTFNDPYFRPPGEKDGEKQTSTDSAGQSDAKKGKPDSSNDSSNKQRSVEF